MESKIKVLDSGVQLRGPDPFGQVTGGFVKITGPELSFRIEYDHETNSAPVLFTIDGNKHVGGHGFVCMDTEDDVLLECTGPWVASEPYWRGDESEQYIRNGFASIDDTTLGL